MEKYGHISVRNVTKDELNGVVRVECEAWPEEVRAPREKFEKRLEVFPQGFFAVYVDGVMAGVSTSQIIQYPNSNLDSWEKITDNGHIVNSHDPEGNALYVVSVGVSSRYQGRGLGSKLVEEQKRLTKKIGLKYLVLGARIPGYHKHSSIPVEDYVVERLLILN